MSGNSPRRAATGMVTAVLRPVLAAAVITVLSTVSAAPASAVVVTPEVDVQILGAVVQAPSSGGISELDEMRYRVTVRNLGPNPLPARSVSIVIRVVNASTPNASNVEVARLTGPVEPEPGGECGTGRRPVTRCTNSQEVPVNGEFQMIVGHLHPEVEAGTLSFVSEVVAREGAYTDPVTGNNFFRGPTYSFLNLPEETTTTTAVEDPVETTLVETTLSPPEETVSSLPEETVSSLPEETTSSVELESTTTTLAPTTLATTTTLSTTTTTVPTTVSTTTTTVPTTVSTAATTSIQPLSDSGADAVGGNEGEVLGASGVAEDPDVAAPLAPGTSDDEGGPPLLLIGGFLAVLVLIGGVGAAMYAYYNRPPPLVDIRQYR